MEIGVRYIRGPFVWHVSRHSSPCEISHVSLSNCNPWLESSPLNLVRFELLQRYLEVNSFFNRWVHGALVYFPIIGPGEDGSIGGGETI